MKRSSWVPVIASCLAVPLAFAGGTPLLDKAERKPLQQLMTEYQQAYLDKNHDKKALKALPKLSQDLRAKLEELAKKKKIETMLASPADLRLLFSVPLRPEASPKKDAYYDTESIFKDGKSEIKVKYLLRVPKSYAAGEPVPIVLTLHPPLKRADEVKKWALAAIPASVTDQSIVIVPLNVDNPVDWNSSDGRFRAIVPFRKTWEGLWVDRARIYVHGVGESAAAAVDYATFFPGMFAGSIVSHPAAALPNKELATASSIPMLCLAQASGSDAAQVVNGFIEEMKKAGGNASLTACELDAAGTLDPAGQEAFGKFVAETRKDVAPKKVKLVTDSDECVNAYWFRVDNVDVAKDEVATMEAEITAQNEIRVTTPATCRGFHVYLNDELVDMGKTIKVVHVVQGKDEAKVVFEGTKARNLDRTTDFWIEAPHGNFAETYTNAIDVTIAP